LLIVIGLVSSQQLLGQSEDVIRTKTELVQTDVTVVDKRGRFVGGLRADDFELRVDSKPQSVSFFEEIATGSVDEAKQLAAARKGDTVKLPATPDSASDRGRVVFFFVDDLHLTSDSLTRARSVITHFVENKMTGKDRVAVISTSGQIGFLQQLTDNKAVLREAISRLNSKYNPETTASKVTISEVDATLVANGDRGLFAYLLEATMKEFQTNALNAYTIVTNRVHQINAQSRLSELDTLARLESLMRSTAPLGLVIYSLGTRPNVFGSGIDVSKNDYPDFSPRTASRSLAESKMPQEPLETLAEETGGRSYLNASALDDGVGEALTESSAYYLLAWRPEGENQRSGKSRIKVEVKGHPELRVRMRQRFFDFRNTEAAAAIKRAPADELKLALGSLYPRRDLPISVSASFANTADKGTVLNASMQIDGASLSFGEREQAIVDVLGIAIDDRGQFSSFKQKLDIPRAVGRFIKWNQSLSLPPGLYQVRVAVRDRQTGRTGSAMTWIEIPLH
jgi:VWFA-related protein